MIPLRDNVASRTFHLVNFAIIAANIWVFIEELRAGTGLDAFVSHYGLVPAAWTIRQLVTSMFLHGSWMHIISNLWVLYIFGGSVEDRLGHFRYLWLYFASGMLAGLTQLFAHLGSDIPTIGASGAIAGVMGAYFVLFPRARIATLVFIFFFFEVIEIPAFIFLGLWFLSQLYSGLWIGHEYGGIAWWAHIGGFVAGMIWARRLLRRGRAR